MTKTVSTGLWVIATIIIVGVAGLTLYNKANTLMNNVQAELPASIAPAAGGN